MGFLSFKFVNSPLNENLKQLDWIVWKSIHIDKKTWLFIKQNIIEKLIIIKMSQINHPKKGSTYIHLI